MMDITENLTPIIRVGLQVDSYRHTVILCVLAPHLRVIIRPANLYMQRSHTRGSRGCHPARH
jgi:hypothetical protein